MAVRPDLNRSHSRAKSQSLRKSLEQSFELTALLEEKLQAKVNESDSLARQLADRDKEARKLHNHLREASKSIAELTQCNSDMRSQLTKVQEDYQSLLSKYEDCAKQLEQWELNGKALREQAEQLTHINRDQLSQLRDLTAQKNHLEAAREVLQGKYEVALREIRELSSRPELPRTVSRVCEVPTRTPEAPPVSALQKENFELHQKCTELASQLAAVQGRLSALKTHHRRPQSVDYYSSSKMKDGVQDYISALSRPRK